MNKVKRHPDKFSGQITVFLTLISAILLTVLLSTIEAGRITVIRNLQRQSVMTASENLLAEFNIPLKEKYHIFAIDGNGRNLQAALEKYVSQNQGCDILSGSIDGIHIAELYPLSDEKYGPLCKEMIQYIKTTGLIDASQEFLEEIELSKLESTDSLKGQISERLKQNENTSQAQAQAASEENSETDAQDAPSQREKEEIAEVKDPRKSLSTMLKGGILQLVLPEGFKISDAALDTTTSESGRFETLTDFTSVSGVTSKMDRMKFSLSGIAGKTLEESMISIYIRNHFKNAAHPESIKFTTKLEYEMEYLICGHKTDVDNLFDMVNRLVMLRTVFNCIYLLTDVGKTTEAHSVAAAIASSLLMPFLEPVIYSLILLAWSYGESLMDVRALISGESVPLIKTMADWQLSLKNLAQMSLEPEHIGLSGNQSSGLEYEEYLMIFLMLSGNQQKYQRIENVMQANIRLEPGYENFTMKDCYYGFSCFGNFKIDPVFLQMTEYGNSVNHVFQWVECY